MLSTHLGGWFKAMTWLSINFYTVSLIIINIGLLMLLEARCKCSSVEYLSLLLIHCCSQQSNRSPTLLLWADSIHDTNGLACGYRTAEYSYEFVINLGHGTRFIILASLHARKALVCGWWSISCGWAWGSERMRVSPAQCVRVGMSGIIGSFPPE